jgi:tetratricopeptide (TPR) repeat protein
VDRLPSSTKAVLQHAAVAGPRFRARILEELLGREIGTELGELCDEALLQRDDGAPSESHEGELSFTAALIREVVYEALSSSARRETHARLGQLLAARHRAGRDEPPATIAEHMELGGELSVASAYWLRAGLVSLAAGDAGAAAERFGRTLAIEDARDDDERSAASRARQREALAGREQAYHQMGEHQVQARDLERLEAMVEDEPHLMADVKNRTAVLRLRMGEFRAAVRASEEAEAAARSSGDKRCLGEAMRIRGEVYERIGDFNTALEMTGKARELFQRIGAVAEETAAMVGIARTHLVRGRYEEASSAYRPIMERVRESGDSWLERLVRNHMAVIHLCLGEYEDAMKSAQRALAVCQRYGDRAREGDCLSVCGIILLEVGRYHEARVYFSRALALLERTGSRWSQADCLVYAGAAEAHLGEYERSLEYLREAIRLSRDIGARYVQANALVALATAMLVRDQNGDWDLASKAAAKAVEVAREATLVGPELQALSRLAEATRRAGNLDKALALSSEAVELLARQRHIEGAEQEIHFTHHELLRAAGDEAGARVALGLARAEVDRKRKGLVNRDWQRAFEGEVAVNAAILKASASVDRGKGTA